MIYDVFSVIGCFDWEIDVFQQTLEDLLCP